MAKSSKSSVKFAKPGVVKGSSKGNGPALPKIIYATASPHSIGGTSMFDFGQSVTAETAASFTCEEALINLAAQRLKSAGFDVLQITESTINIAGSAQTYEKGVRRTHRDQAAKGHQGIRRRGECRISRLPQ